MIGTFEEKDRNDNIFVKIGELLILIWIRMSWLLGCLRPTKDFVNKITHVEQLFCFFGN